MNLPSLPITACSLGLITLLLAGWHKPLKAQNHDSVETETLTLPPTQVLPEVTDDPLAPFIEESLESDDALTDLRAWSADYRLGPGDVLDVSVFEADEYSGEVVVIQDGSIILPRAGKVLVQGYTLEQATDVIVAAYATYIRNPIVTVQPLRFRPVQVGIAGEVRRPGSYVISTASSVSSNSVDTIFPTLTQAIAEAGGITSEADLRSIELQRQVGPSQAQSVQVNLWDLIQSGDLSQDIILQSGDTSLIPTALALTPEESTQLASASFAPESIQIYVAGEVEDPGIVEVPLNAPLNQALLVAGGFNPRAARRAVELVRVNPDGTASQQSFEIDFAAGVGAANNPILRDQDVVVVERSGFARTGDSVDILLSPVTRILNAILGFDRLLF
jgi:polysaccharide export outer membrane protein